MAARLFGIPDEFPIVLRRCSVASPGSPSIPDSI